MTRTYPDGPPRPYYVYDWDNGAIVTVSWDDVVQANPTRFFVTKQIETAKKYAEDEAAKRLDSPRSAAVQARP